MCKSLNLKIRLLAVRKNLILVLILTLKLSQIIITLKILKGFLDSFLNEIAINEKMFGAKSAN